MVKKKDYSAELKFYVVHGSERKKKWCADIPSKEIEND